MAYMMGKHREARSISATIIALVCLLGLFFGLENETSKDIHPMGFSNIHDSSEVTGGDADAGHSGAFGNHSEVFERLHSQRCPLLWRSYLKAYGPDKQQMSEQFPSTQGLDFSQTTSRDHTRITIFNDQPTYNLCDVLLVKIESRDWHNQSKTYGGDFFRMKIFQEKPYSAASEDTIIDFQNGTYLAFFTLRWTGEVKVDVKLIHPVEVLPQMMETLSGKFGEKILAVGGFMAGNISEDVICRFVEVPNAKCNLSNPSTHGPWYCEKPKNPSLACEDWRFHKMKPLTNMSLAENLTPLSEAMLKKSHMVGIKNNYRISVQSGNISNSVSILPLCQMDGIPTGIHSSGHFFEGRWYPDNCTVNDLNTSITLECLRNEKIVILGDSTSRQIFTYFRENYRYKDKPVFEALPLPQGAMKHRGPVDIRSSMFNISIRFHFHGLPRFGSGLVLGRNMIEFIADRINSGRDGCDVVYILSVWAHFVVAGREFYVQRMLAIKRAIGAFLDRCPGARVIIKGANTREHPKDLWKSIISSEWCIVKQELALRELFRDEKRVGFIDSLDITKAQSFKDNVHPNKKIVREFVNRALTIICEN